MNEGAVLVLGDGVHGLGAHGVVSIGLQCPPSPPAGKVLYVHCGGCLRRLTVCGCLGGVNRSGPLSTTTSRRCGTARRSRQQ